MKVKRKPTRKVNCGNNTTALTVSSDLGATGGLVGDNELVDDFTVVNDNLSDPGIAPDGYHILASVFSRK